MRPSRALPAVLILCAGAVAGCSGASSSKDAGGSGTVSASGPSSPSRATSPSAPRTSAPRTTASASSAPSPSAPHTTAAPSPSAPHTTAVPTDRPTEGPSSPPTRNPHLPRDRTEAAALHTSVLVRSSADTTQEQAVVGAWMDYWQAASDTFYRVRPTKELLAVARDQALSSVLDYIGTLAHDQRRVVGWAKDHVTSVEVHGDTAGVRDCTENFTFSVDRDGDPVTRPTPFYQVTGSLARVDGRWYVTRTHTENLTSTCLA
jgi:hypothetical protein